MPQDGRRALEGASLPFGIGELLLLAIGLLTIALGIAIAYVAFRGYRRNDSRPMLFVAIGFVLVLAFPTVFDFLLYVLVSAFDVQLPVDTIYVSVISQIGQLLGMASILYALLMQ